MLTRPSAANKNFPYHVRTTQIGFVDESVNPNFERAVYRPETEEVELHRRMATLFAANGITGDIVSWLFIHSFIQFFDELTWYPDQFLFSKSARCALKPNWKKDLKGWLCFLIFFLHLLPDFKWHKIGDTTYKKINNPC